MGVKDLVNVIRKHCPSLIQPLPNRFQDLAGKTVVIDATLLTQRFHFARNPHQYRHLIGWYQLAKELEDARVNAYCVFDGNLRSPAKQDETRRRKEVHQVVLDRLKYEQKRMSRLEKNTSVLKNWMEADDSTRGDLSSKILNATTPPIIRGKSTKSSSVSAVKDGQREKKERTSPPRSSKGLKATPSLKQPLLAPSSQADEVHALYPTQISPSKCSSGTTIEFGEEDTAGAIREDETAYLIQEEEDDADLPPVEGDTKPVQSVIDSLATLALKITLETLDLSDTIEELGLPGATVLDAALTNIALSDENEELDSSVLSLQPIPLTPHQREMTRKENKAMKALAGVGRESEISRACVDNAKGSLEELMLESGELVEVLEKRSSPPTKQTYNESIELLEAMGVPCITVADAVEAEALAASMTKHGLADYVVTEDSDVLVYGARMLRNVTSRQDPIILICGSDIPSSLDLDYNSFIDFVILLGNDFTARIKNIGPARGLAFIRKYHSIERILEEELAYPLTISKDAYMRKVSLARDIFMTHPPVPDVSRLSKKKNDGKVTRLLEKYNLGSAILNSDDWQVASTLALDGNYFGDDPNAS